MKLLKPILFAFLTITLECFAQGTFQNLDFEDANPSAGNSTAALFPGWDVYIGTTQQSLVGYDSQVNSIPFASILELGYAPIQGNYTAFLVSASYGDPVFISDPVSLTQTGTVPSGTESVELDAYEINGGSFVLSFDGVEVPMAPLQTFPNYTLYGGNVSEWAGQTALLDITQLAPTSPDGEHSPSGLQLDDITFSPNAITTTPEPDPFILMGIGGALFAAYRRFAQKRR